MKEKHLQILGIVFSIVYFIAVAWLYVAAPKSLEDVSTKARETVENVATKGQIIVGAYEIDRAKFDEGLRNFRAGNFVAARDSFLRADPERLDASVQFYIAYSFYRQGWGKVYNDDQLFKQGLDQVNRVIELDRDYKSADADLKLRTPAELKNELEEGLQTTPEDLNPLKIFRERK